MWKSRAQYNKCSQSAAGVVSILRRDRNYCKPHMPEPKFNEPVDVTPESSSETPASESAGQPSSTEAPQATPFSAFMNKLAKQREALAQIKVRKQAYLPKPLTESMEVTAAKERQDLLKEIIGQQLEGDPDLAVDMSELGEKIAEEYKMKPEHYYGMIKERIVDVLAKKSEGLFKSMLEGPASDLTALDAAVKIDPDQIRAMLGSAEIDVRKKAKEERDALNKSAATDEIRGGLDDISLGLQQQEEARKRKLKAKGIKPGPKPEPKKGFWQRLTGS
ncbi:hypothetical protein HY633_05000 [Candidatus Uhrbacteria bacterium]|nr:hypothetical protein [Candidatus Uhrbacteria bacterium]